MVYERHRQIVNHRIREKPVDRVIQAGHLILACSCDEHRKMSREVLDSLSRARILKLPFRRSLGDDSFSGPVQHVSVAYGAKRARELGIVNEDDVDRLVLK